MSASHGYVMQWNGKHFGPEMHLVLMLELFTHVFHPQNMVKRYTNVACDAVCSL